MAARKRIAILYSANYNRATSIVIYVQNIIRHFNAMDDSIKPHLLFLYTSDSPIDELRQIKYPYADYISIDQRLSLITRAFNRIGMLCLGKPLIRNRINADFAFPALNMDILKNVKQLIFWKEDFQESYYPEYFNEDAFLFVKGFFNVLESNAKNILVLSSYSVGKDLKKFYPHIQNKIHFLRFVSLLPQLIISKLPSLKQKFNITKPYFIVCNQFWPHKNHMQVLTAIQLLKEQGIFNYSIIFTGKTSTYRDNNYFSSIQRYIEENNLDKQIIITGFMPREEQLLLMKDSIAVIQPSLFEGWSTVIEDAKALNKYILATDLPVNIEQVQKNVSFFQIHNATQLANLMKELLDNNLMTVPINYEDDIKYFKASLANLFELAVIE